MAWRKLSLRFARGLSTISRVGVVGGGQMGSGIAYVSAVNAKIPVVVVDQSEEACKASMNLNEKLLNKAVAKNKLTQQDADDSLARIMTSTSMDDLKACDFVIEAVTESIPVKESIFSNLDQICPPSTILASNTSSISITMLGAATKRPDKVVGMHFMNPVPVMKLIELISGLRTSEETMKATRTLGESMGKITTTSADTPGFIANRLLMPYINEAVFALGEGIGTKEDIDTTMKLGTNVPMGPLTLADFIGLDTCLAIMEVLHRELGDSKYRPAPLLKNYVKAGLLGKKAGEGFYKY